MRKVPIERSDGLVDLEYQLGHLFGNVGLLPSVMHVFCFTVTVFASNDVFLAFPTMSGAA